MRVSELAQTGGVTAETVRHYTREGLLQPHRDPRNGYQLYDAESLGRLRFIDCLRSLGVSLPEIKQILSWADQGTAEFIEPVPLATQRGRLYLRAQEFQVIARWIDNMNQDKMTESFSLKELIESLGSRKSDVEINDKRGHH
ncbi:MULTISPECIES: MerR family transcriptional regulator [Halomonadaceae]|jgi:MerR family copper efflux transcriptional regulator|uniref:MerR family transcriptional regulator n=6 Tax=Vreelandella TaxID=3137766 RepID=A0A3S0W5A4_9GAMM|nr:MULTISPECIES: MerR family transcriptional regulator [Halomonas]AJY52945.1 transcriptional regulator, MerR family [Halomonas sp. KO116]NVF16463.1 MerR family transcriptional regulator [Halomonas maris]NYS80389.1 MerR family transcriptional regulator [Halomonas glaciei]QHD48605.1 DNA-binding protein [Halomonas meridiana]RBI65241.1 MerR family transcriptional regulator [Halomonas sulfidaeris]|tara:strand:- start:146 stop:571 length:426 start_codon:yes stop_codon:yes gene_type:complete